MTLLRKAAVRVSGFVARHAGAGSREWAEGFAREVEFIDGDWEALRWAVGGLPVLLTRREASLDSLEKAVSLAEGYFEKRKNQTEAGCFILTPFLMLFAFYLAEACKPMERIGVGIVLASLMYAIFRTYKSTGRKADRSLGPYEMAAEYRLALQREHKSYVSWRNRIGSIVWWGYAGWLCISTYKLDHSVWLEAFIFGLLVGGGLVGDMRKRMKDQRNLRRIADIDALLVRDATEGM
jgi:hypothetical protein